jgi:antitoxin (DNA-binding transcriptional repressor) of toxin-antitoxin stability system
MQRVTISQLKNRLSAYLRKVRAGQTLLILDRDEPVARIERVAGDTPADDRIARLERAGLVRRRAEPLAVKTLRGRGRAAPGRSVVEALLEERREGR